MYGLRYFHKEEEIILLYPQYDYNINVKNIELQTEENTIIKIKTINLHIDLLKNKGKLKVEIGRLLFDT